jgi:hypothetical protein
MIVILAAVGGFSLGMVVAAMLVIAKEQDEAATGLALSSRFFVDTRTAG